MKTYCLSSRKHTNNTSLNKVIRRNPKCTNCTVDKTRFLKQKT